MSDKRKSFFGRDDTPRLYHIFKGEIARIQPYGVFVKIPGFKRQGLVHKSQMSNTPIDSPEEIANAGEEVYCKVISLDDDKVALSMKFVNQTTGQDLDENHVQADLEKQKRRTGYSKDRKKIELEAVLNTTCSKCGGSGHFAQDCFHSSGGKGYELLPDIDDLMTEAQQDVEFEKREKQKKKKTKKKKKKHKHQSESDDSDSEKHKKRERKRHIEDDSDSANDSDEKHKKHKGHRRQSHDKYDSHLSSKKHKHSHNSSHRR